MYELLRRHLPVVRGVQGLIKSSIKVSGTLGVPLIRAEVPLSLSDIADSAANARCRV